MGKELAEGSTHVYYVAPGRGFEGRWLTSYPQLALVGYIDYARFGGLEFGLYSAGTDTEVMGRSGAR